MNINNPSFVLDCSSNNNNNAQVAFSDVLRAAFGGSIYRKQAEQELQNQCSNDPASFFTNLMKVFIEEQHPSQQQSDITLRQFAGTLIKNSTRLPYPATASPNHPNGSTILKQFLWDALPLELRENIKQSLLATMMSKHPIIQITCANVISTIFTIEVARDNSNGGWENLLRDLTSSTAANLSSDIRKAAVLTLGQICDKLNELELGHHLSASSKESVLASILIGISPSESEIQIIESSIIAFGDCVGMMKDLFERTQVRDFTMDSLLRLLNHSEQRIVSIALQRCSDFVSVVPQQHLKQYVTAMLHATASAISIEKPEICVPAVEIWSTIAWDSVKEQQASSQSQFSSFFASKSQNNSNNNSVKAEPLVNAVEPVLEDLVRLLLKNLSKNNDSDSAIHTMAQETNSDSSESSIQDCSEKALSVILQSARSTRNSCVLNIVVSFVEAALSSNLDRNQVGDTVGLLLLEDKENEWKITQAGLLGLTSIVKGAQKTQAVAIVSSKFASVIELLKHTKQHVQVSQSVNKSLAQLRLAEVTMGECAAKLILRICKAFADTILRSREQSIEYELESMILAMQVQPLIAVQILWSFVFLLQSAANSSQFQLTYHLIRLFLETASKNKEASRDQHLVLSFYMCVIQIVRQMKETECILMHFELFIAFFKTTYQIHTSKVSPLQSGILTSIHSCMISLNNKLSETQADSLYEMIEQYIRFQGDCCKEGIYLLAEFASCVGTDGFSKYFTRAFQFILHGLQNSFVIPDVLESILFAIKAFSAVSPRFLAKELFVVFPILVAGFQHLSEQQQSSNEIYSESNQVKQRREDDWDELEQTTKSSWDIKLSILSCIQEMCIYLHEDLPDEFLAELLRLFDASFLQIIQFEKEKYLQEKSELEKVNNVKEKVLEAYKDIFVGMRESKRTSISLLFFSHFPKALEFIKLTADPSQFELTLVYLRTSLIVLTEFYDFFKETEIAFELNKQKVFIFSIINAIISNGNQSNLTVTAVNKAYQAFELQYQSQDMNVE